MKLRSLLAMQQGKVTVSPKVPMRMEVSPVLPPSGKPVADKLQAALITWLRAWWEEEKSQYQEIKAAKRKDQTWKILRDALSEPMQEIATQSAHNLLDTLNIDNETQHMIAERLATKAAKKRAREAAKIIVANTKQMLKSVRAKARLEGWTKEEFAAELADRVFGSKRAINIVNVELGKAHIAGARSGWSASGVEAQKIWVVAEEHDGWDVCDENEADGPIDMDDVFTSGDTESPAHPNCICRIAFIRVPQ